MQGPNSPGCCGLPCLQVPLRFIDSKEPVLELHMVDRVHVKRRAQSGVHYGFDPPVLLMLLWQTPAAVNC